MTFRSVRLALKFVMKNDGDSVDITLIYSKYFLNHEALLRSN